MSPYGSRLIGDVEDVAQKMFPFKAIDLLAILQKSLVQAIFLYFFIHKVRLNGVRASIRIVRIRKSTKCNEISFDPHSFSERLKGLLSVCLFICLFVCLFVCLFFVCNLILIRLYI